MAPSRSRQARREQQSQQALPSQRDVLTDKHEKIRLKNALYYPSVKIYHSRRSDWGWGRNTEALKAEFQQKTASQMTYLPRYGPLTLAQTKRAERHLNHNKQRSLWQKACSISRLERYQNHSDWSEFSDAEKKKYYDRAMVLGTMDELFLGIQVCRNFVRRDQSKDNKLYSLRYILEDTRLSLKHGTQVDWDYKVITQRVPMNIIKANLNIPWHHETLASRLKAYQIIQLAPLFPFTLGELRDYLGPKFLQKVPGIWVSECYVSTPSGRHELTVYEYRDEYYLNTLGTPLYDQIDSSRIIRNSDGDAFVTYHNRELVQQLHGLTKNLYGCESALQEFTRKVGRGTIETLLAHLTF